MDAPPPPAAPPAMPTAPPTKPGAIPGRPSARLPAAAKVVAWLDIAFGAFMVVSAMNPAGQRDPYALVMGVFVPLGLGVLLRSNIVRIVSRLAHGLMGLLVIVALISTIIGFLTGPPTNPAAGNPLMTAFLVLFSAMFLAMGAFFVWAAFVLGRKDVRAACRRRLRATPEG
ncbi:MAG: hypothetical protein RIB58_09120 [Phycisphaerales bacterium]